jgi:hypothetical protein
MAKVRKPIPKTQKQLSNEQVTPTYPQYGDPNDFIQTPQNNRALNTSFKGDTTKPFSVGIQDIDEAIYYYFQNVVQPSVTQNGARLNVPVIYGSPEKWKSFQKDGYYRDQKGKIMAPLIMFKKTDITKNRQIANKLDANYPNNFGVFTKEYTQRNAYDNFKVLANRKPQKQYYAVVMPDYLTVTYECAVFTYYVEQLNKIVESMEYASDAYWGDPQRYQFKASIDSFGFQTELAQDDERIVRSTFTLKINGYIIPEILQKDVTALKKFSNITKTTFTLEDEPTTPITEAPLPPIPFTCAPGTVINSGSTYIDSVNSGGTLILPNQTININITGSGLIPSVGDIGINLTYSGSGATVPTSASIINRDINLIIPSNLSSFNVNLVDRFGNDLGTKPVTANENWDLRTLTPFDWADIYLSRLSNPPTGSQLTAVYTFFTDMINAGIFQGSTKIELDIGGNAADHSWNARYPFDNNSSMRSIYVGSPIHDANGVSLNGTTQAVRTNCYVSYLNDFDKQVSIYSRNNIIGAGATLFNSGQANSPQGFGVIQDSRNRFYTEGIILAPNQTDSIGLMSLSRISSTTMVFKRNTINQSFSPYTDLAATYNRVTEEITIGAQMSKTLVFSVFKQLNYCYFRVGNALTDAQEISHYNIVQALQTALGRQV